MKVLNSSTGIYSQNQNTNQQSFKRMNFSNATDLGERSVYELSKVFKGLKKTHEVKVRTITYPFCDMNPDLKITIEKTEKSFFKILKALINRKQYIVETPEKGPITEGLKETFSDIVSYHKNRK